MPSQDAPWSKPSSDPLKDIHDAYDLLAEEDPLTASNSKTIKVELTPEQEHILGLAFGAMAPKVKEGIYKTGTPPLATDFQHPVSDYTVEFQPGDVLYAHQKTENVFLMVHADGTATKFNKHGQPSILNGNTAHNNPALLEKLYYPVAKGPDVLEKKEIQVPKGIVDDELVTWDEISDYAATTFNKLDKWPVFGTLTMSTMPFPHETSEAQNEALLKVVSSPLLVNHLLNAITTLTDGVSCWDALTNYHQLEIQNDRQTLIRIAESALLTKEFLAPGEVDWSQLEERLEAVEEYTKNFSLLIYKAPRYARQQRIFLNNKEAGPLGDETIGGAPWLKIEEALDQLILECDEDLIAHLTDEQGRVLLRAYYQDPLLLKHKPEDWSNEKFYIHLQDEILVYAQETKFLATLEKTAQENLSKQAADNFDALFGPSTGNSQADHWVYTTEVTEAEIPVGWSFNLYDCGDGITFVLHHPETKLLCTVIAYAPGDVSFNDMDPEKSPHAYYAAEKHVAPEKKINPPSVAPMVPPAPVGISDSKALVEALHQGLVSIGEGTPLGVVGSLPHVSIAAASGNLGVLTLQLEGAYEWLLGILDLCLEPSVSEHMEIEKAGEYNELRKSIVDYLKSGKQYSDDGDITLLWKDPVTNTVWPLKEGAKVLLQQEDSYECAWLIPAEGPGIQTNQGWKDSNPSYLMEWQYTNPVGAGYTVTAFSNITQITLESAYNEGHDFGAWDWKIVEQAESIDPKKFKVGDQKIDEMSAVSTQQVLAAVIAGWNSESPELSHIGPNSLPLLNVSLQKLVLFCNMVGDKDVLAIVNYKLAKGYYGTPAPVQKQVDLPEEPASPGVSTELSLTLIDKTLGGMHTKHVYMDQNGNEWMAKSFPSDPNAKARVDAEHWANKIGRLYGFRQPETRIFPKLGGAYSYVQFLVPSDTNVGPVEKTDEQLAQILEEHVLDWLISNHDSNSENLLIASGSGDIIGIDKGQAWRFLGEDKLEVGYLPHTNPLPTYYDHLYKNWLGLSNDQRKLFTERVLRKAWFVQKRYTAQFSAMVHSALEERQDFGIFNSREELIAAAVDRKETIFHEFLQFYQDLWADNGLEEWTIDVASLFAHTINDDVHIGISQDLLDEVKQVAVHGKALFFNSPHLDDAHILLYTETSAEGETLLKGEARLLKDADLLVTNWLQEQTVKDISTTTHKAKPKKVEPDYASLPGNDYIFAALIAYTKTVSHHHEDHEYNPSTVSQANKVVKLIAELLGKYEGKMAIPTIVWKDEKIVTTEQGEAWFKMLKTYLKWFSQVDVAKSTGVKVSLVSGDTPYKQVTYTPSKAAIAEVTGSQPEPTVEPPAEELSSGLLTSDSGKIFTVTKTNNSGTLGKFDPKTGQLKHHQSNELTDGYHGYKYVIAAPDHSVEYRPWNEPGITISQRGLLRFTVSPWQGTEAQLEDVLDTLRTIGVDLSPADEESLELFYWKHLREILLDRKDADKAPYYGGEALLKQDWKDSLSSSEEIALLRKVWSANFGHKSYEQLNDVDWYPHFSHTRIHDKELTCGKPHWYRPDCDLLKLRKIYGLTLPAHNLSNISTLPNIVASGGLWATEERLRMLGSFITGMSSPQDQGTGGATSIFFRQNRGTQDGAQLYLHPQAVLRTSNYAFSGDQYGKIENKTANAFFDLAKACKHSDAGNELMIKYGVSFLDDVVVIVVENASHRKQILKFFTDHGITQLHGRPIDQVVVSDVYEASHQVEAFWTSLLSS